MSQNSANPSPNQPQDLEMGVRQPSDRSPENEDATVTSRSESGQRQSLFEFLAKSLQQLLRMDRLESHHVGYAMLYSCHFASDIFAMLHMRMFYTRKITALDIAAVHTVYFIWNTANDLFGACFV